MNLYYVAIIVLLLLLVGYFVFTRLLYGHHNTSKVAGCNTCDKFRVHNFHDDKESASFLINEINTRNQILMNYLKEKYLKTYAGIDPYKSNRIDVIPPSDLYADMIKHLQDFNPQENSKVNYIQERIEQLLKNYNVENIYEISPLNKSNITSYTQDKSTLILCLRRKDGNHELHDINTMMFVVLHELSHMMNDQWGHKPDFWSLFKFMLQNAIESGIYQPINYTLRPIVYCGLRIAYNPIFDNTI